MKKIDLDTVSGICEECQEFFSPSGRGPIEWTRADAPHDPISDVDYVKPMLLPHGGVAHGRGPRLAPGLL